MWTLYLKNASKSLNVDLIHKILIIKHSIDVRQIFKGSIESCFVEFKSELIKFNCIFM